MRFYLLYKNHGLYDPVLDDTEYYYVPITEDDFQSDISGQTYTISYEDTQNVEHKNGTNGTFVNWKENKNADFEDNLKSNLKDAFLHINVEDLPPSARFKLPVSDEYDPEGKKVSKLQRLYQNILNNDVKKLSEQKRLEENETYIHLEDVRQDMVKEILRQNEMTKKETKYIENNNKDTNTLKETATEIVEKNINKAVTHAEFKQNSKIDKNVEFTEIKFKKESVDKMYESIVEKIENKTKLTQDRRIRDNHEKKSTILDKKPTKKVTFNENENKEFSEMIFSEESNENETISEENEPRLTAEKRKLLRRQDVEEVIKPGTVRDRSEIFKKYNIINDVAIKTDYKCEKSDIKEMEEFSSKIKKATHDARISCIKNAQQRVFNIGAQMILNVWRATYPSSGIMLLKAYFSHITKIMSKCVTFKSLPYFTTNKDKKNIEQRKEMKGNGFSKMLNGELIIKHKLSGAKLAQIEGMKPEELTKKMNIVILELQRKSGIEEEFDKKDFDKKDFEQFDESRSKTDIENDSQDTFYQSYTHYDNKQNKYNIYETTKTQSMEIKEMKSEKRCTEYKTTKTNSNVRNEEENEITTDNGNIIYVAIVEAHVYTNKDAIFEEHLRRLSESKNVIERTEELSKISDLLETTDKLNVYVGFDESRKLSLASAGSISDEEFSSLNVIETKPIKYIRSPTDFEHVAKKIAVQNITQIIEPLLHTESKTHTSNKQAHTVLEMPVKSIAETTDVSTEEQQVYFDAQVFVTQKSYLSVEEPDKSVIEITEISADEDESAVFEESKMKVELPRTAIETPVKSIAEISEVLIKEDEIVDIVISKPNTVEVQPVIDITEKAVAITSEVFVDEASAELFNVPKTTSKTTNTVLKNTSMSVAETITTTPERSSEFLGATTETRKETAKMKISQNIATEVSCISIEESNNEKIVMQKPQFEQANIGLTTNVAAEVQDITVIEKEQRTFDVPKIKDMKSESLMENIIYSVAETTQKFSIEPRNEPVEEFQTRNQNAGVQVQEFNATESNIVHSEEPKQQHLEIKDIKEKQPRALVEKTNFTVAEISTILPVQRSNEIEVVIETPQQANISIEELKAAEIMTVSTEESLQQNLELPQLVEKLPQTLLESCVLTLAEAQALVPEGPKDETFEIEPVTMKQTKTLIESPLLTIAESLDILPGGPMEGVFEVTETPKGQSHITFEDLKPLNTSIVYIEDQHEELKVPQIEDKFPHMIIETPNLTVPISLAILPEEPKHEDIEIPKVIEKQPLSELESPRYALAETISVIPEGPKAGSLEINKISGEKQPEAKIQEVKLNIAETFTIIPEEPKYQTFAVTKTINQEARINVEELKAAETKIITFEETAKENLKLPEITKSLEKQAHVDLVESSATMVAETTAVTVAKEETFKYFNKEPVTAKLRDVKLEIVDVSDDSRNFADVDLNYTVKLPEEHDDKVDEVFAEITITKQKTPPLEVYAEYEINENKAQLDSNIYESIKLLKRQRHEQSMDESYSYTALISDAEFNKKVEEELIKIMSSTIEASEYIQNGDISTYSFSLSSSALAPFIEEYLFRIRGPTLKRFQYIEDVFEEATLRLKSKFKSSTIENFDASLTLILQDIATSQLQSNVIDVNIDSREYISEKDVKMQYFDAKKTVKYEEKSVQSSEKQSLHTDVAIANAATKQTMETGIDVTVLAIEEEPIIEANRQSKTARKTKSSKKSAKSGAIQAESVIGTVDIEAIESDAQMLQENVEVSMQNDLSIEMNRSQQSQLQMSERKGIVMSSYEAVSKSISLESDKKLAVRTDLTTNESNDIITGSPSPPMTPPTPLIDEYFFRLEIPLPRDCKYVPRDCSYSPESVEDDIILRNGLIPHIITRIERIIYSPPLPTPPVSPEREIIPIYKKPGLRGGSNEETRINARIFDFFS